MKTNPFSEVHLLSLPPIQPYDIIPDIWNTPVKTTVGSLLAGGTTDYSRDVLTALNITINQQHEVQNTEPISTTAMKMKVKVNDQLIVSTPDTGAAISIISSSLAKQLNLTALPMPPQKIHALNSQTQVIGVIEDAPIKIQQAKVPIHLRVVESAKPILLLDMDWHKKYQVLVNVSEQTLEFTTQGQRYRTIVEYSQESQVNNLKCF